jgi:hypothetical protein
MATVAVDCHLLFGLLALQNGLIDEGQLMLACKAWTRDKARGLADQLVARGDLDPDDRSAVDALVARHIKKHGDVEHNLAAIPANRSTRAGLAELGEPEVEATLARVSWAKNGHASDADDDDDPDRTAGLRPVNCVLKANRERGMMFGSLSKSESRGPSKAWAPYSAASGRTRDRAAVKRSAYVHGTASPRPPGAARRSAG